MNSKFYTLFDKWYNHQKLSDEEVAELMKLMNEAESNGHLYDEIKVKYDQLGDQTWFTVEQKATMLDTILELGGRPAKKVSLYKFVAAASVLLILGAFFFFFYPTGNKTLENRQATRDHKLQHTIAPGKMGAILTLADGSQVLLDTIENGTVAMQGGLTVKIQNGNLIYSGNATDRLYNTAATPAGRQFKIQLPDGTNVWLNAASSIRYPTRFDSKERVVDISGEAYLEVNSDARKPFLVKTDNGCRIEVLGTQFNISAYHNEKSINTTLINGAVKVGTVSKNVLLKPGQQAQFSDGIKVVSGLDVSKIISWKNGYFNFDDMRLEDVMKQLERWYDIEVSYEQGVKDLAFYGTLRRDLDLNQILEAFKDFGIKYSLQGRKLKILK